MTDEQVFDADFLQRLRTLFFKLRRRRMLKQKGIQQTQAVGFTREFKDYRHYTRSDDFRAIDWRLFARVETPLREALRGDPGVPRPHPRWTRSRSMVEPFPRKRVATLRLAVALAYLGLMNQHRVSMLLRPSSNTLKHRGAARSRGRATSTAILQHVTRSATSTASRTSSALRKFRPSRVTAGASCSSSPISSASEPEQRRPRPCRSPRRGPPRRTSSTCSSPRRCSPKIDGEVRLDGRRDGRGSPAHADQAATWSATASRVRQVPSTSSSARAASGGASTT